MSAPAALVIDSSLTLAWCFEEEQTPQTQALLKRLDVDNACVPALWLLEVTNCLLVGERRRRITQAQTAEFITVLKSLPIIIHNTDAGQVFNNILLLARAQKLSMYDAAYLELALRLALPLATLDTDLQRAARAMGIALLP